MKPIHIVSVLLLASFVGAQTDSRIDREHLMSTLSDLRKATMDKRQVREQYIGENIRQFRLNFAVTDEVIQEMRRAGASERLIEIVKASGLTAQEILESARLDFQAGRFRQAAAAAEKAAALQSSAAAWELVATSKLKSGDVPGARESYLKEIAAGGEITIGLVVAPPGENFRAPCEGKLIISRRRLAIITNPPCRIALDTTDGRLVEAKRNEFVGTERQAFHITMRSARGETQTFSLAPADQDAQTRDWIIRTLQFFREP